MSVKPIPDGFTAVTPYLIVPDVDAQCDFLHKAFGAVINFKMPMPDGKAGHAEVTINGAKIMMGRSMGQYPPMPVMLYLYVTDVDAVFAQAVAAGGKAANPVADQFYGDRLGMVTDPHGNQWSIATHKQDLTPEQIAENMKKMKC
jgi:PhnB protein